MEKIENKVTICSKMSIACIFRDSLSKLHTFCRSNVDSKFRLGNYHRLRSITAASRSLQSCRKSDHLFVLGFVALNVLHVSLTRVAFPAAFLYILSRENRAKVIVRKVTRDASSREVRRVSIIIIILFRSEKSDACPWKPSLADPSDTIGIVPPLCTHSLTLSRSQRAAAHLLSAPEHRQIILSEPPPTRVSVGGSIFSIYALLTLMRP